MSFKDPVEKVKGILLKFESSNNSLERMKDNFENLVEFFKSSEIGDDVSLCMFVKDNLWRFNEAFKTVFKIRRQIEEKKGTKIVQNMFMCLGYLISKDIFCKEFIDDQIRDIFSYIFTLGTRSKNIMALSVWCLGIQNFPDDKTDWESQKAKIHYFLKRCFDNGEELYKSSYLIFETLSTLNKLSEKKELEFDKFASHWLCDVLKYAVLREPPFKVDTSLQKEYFLKSHKIALEILSKVFNKRETFLPKGLVPNILTQRKDRRVVNKPSLDDCKKGVIKLNLKYPQFLRKKGDCIYSPDKFNELSYEEKLGKLRYLYISVLCNTREFWSTNQLKSRLSSHISIVVTRECKLQNDDTTELRKFSYNLLELCVHSFCIFNKLEILKRSDEFHWYFRTLFCIEGGVSKNKKKGNRLYFREKNDEAREILLKIWFKILGQLWNKGFDTQAYKIFMKGMIRGICRKEKSDGNIISSLTFLSNFVWFQKNNLRFTKNTGRTEGVPYVENCVDFQNPLQDIKNFLLDLISKKKILMVGEQSLLFNSLCKRVMENYHGLITNDINEKKRMRKIMIEMVISLCEVVTECQNLYFSRDVGLKDEDEEEKEVLSLDHLRELIFSMSRTVLTTIPFHYPKRKRKSGEKEKEYVKDSPDVFRLLLLPWLPKVKTREKKQQQQQQQQGKEEEEEEEEEVEGEGQDGDIVMKEKSEVSERSKKENKSGRQRRIISKEEEEKNFGVFSNLHELALKKFDESESKRIKLYVKTFTRRMLATQDFHLDPLPNSKKERKARIPLVSHATFVRVWGCTVDALIQAIPTGQTVRSGQEKSFYNLLFLPMHRYTVVANSRVSFLRKIVKIRRECPRNQRTERQKEEMKILKAGFENYIPDNASIQVIIEKWKVLFDRHDKVCGYSTLFPKLNRDVLTVTLNRAQVLASNPAEEGKIFHHLGNFLIRIGAALFELLGTEHFVEVVEYNLHLSRYLMNRNCYDLLNEHLRILRKTVIQSDVDDLKSRKASETLEGYTKLFNLLFSYLDVKDTRTIPNGYPYDLSNVWKTVLDSLFGAIIEKKLYDENGFLWKVSPLLALTLGMRTERFDDENNPKIRPSPIVGIDRQIESARSLIKEHTIKFWNERLGNSSRRLEFTSDLKDIVTELNEDGVLHLPSLNIPRMKITPTQRKNEEEVGDNDMTTTNLDLDPLPGRKRRRPKPIQDQEKKKKSRQRKRKVNKDGYAMIEDEEEEEDEDGNSQELQGPTLDGSLAMSKKSESVIRARKRRRVVVDEMNESIMPHNTINDFGTLADLNKYGEFASPSSKEKKKKRKSKMKDEDEEEEEIDPTTQVVNPINLNLGSSVSSSSRSNENEGDISDRQDVERFRGYMLGATGILRNISSEKGKLEAREILEGLIKELL